MRLVMRLVTRLGMRLAGAARNEGACAVRLLLP